MNEEQRAEALRAKAKELRAKAEACNVRIAELSTKLAMLRMQHGRRAWVYHVMVGTEIPAQRKPEEEVRWFEPASGDTVDLNECNWYTTVEKV